MTMSRDPVSASLRGLTQKVAELQRLYERLKGQESIPLTNWTTWTPTITQSGAVTATVTRSRYSIVEKICHVQVVLAVTGTGTTANAIRIGGQPTAIQAVTTGLVLGNFMLLDSGAAFYVGAVFANGATDWQLYAHAETAAVGIDPGFALANNDVIRLNCVYEVA